MHQILILPFLALTIVGSTLAATSLVIPPIRSDGAEVALIFVPGAKIQGEEYMKTAVAIQKAAPLKLWVALTGNYTLNAPNPLQLPGTVEGAMSQLQAAGFKGDNFAGIAHSLGGIFLPPVAKDLNMKAVVLLGAYLTKGNLLKDYPLPLMTLSGELDGQTRITRIAVEYEHLLTDLKSNPDAKFRNPVISMKGTNHAQFASGPMPSEVKEYDIEPEVTEDEAHALIGANVADFLTVTFSNVPTDVQSAKANLAQAFEDSSSRFEPLLKLKSLDSDGGSSPWAITSMRTIAEDLGSKTTTYNVIKKSTSSFLGSRSSLKLSDGKVIINTTALLSYPTNPMDISTSPESPTEIAIKFKSYEAVQQALHARRLTPGSVTCRSLNELALSVALHESTKDAQRRYATRARPIIFSNDVKYGTGIQWASSPLHLDETDTGLHVRSYALKTSITSPFLPGNFYCKLLSPYRAMEWINVDSLRKHKPKASTSKKIFNFVTKVFKGRK